jgi:hypothetical protein
MMVVAFSSRFKGFAVLSFQNINRKLRRTPKDVTTWDNEGFS